MSALAAALSDLRAALSFLTVVGGGSRPRRGAARWYGPVGLALGAVLGAWWWVAEWLTTPLLAAALVVLADLTLTGMLHVDGLADSADGLLPPVDRERRLTIMRRPDVGAFGVAAVAVALLLRWSALASLVPDVGLLAALWALSRAAMAAIMASLAYARTEGLASPFRDRRSAAAGAVIGTVVALLVAAASGGWVSIAALLGGAAGAAAVAALARRRLGGFTGDVLGAAGVVAETVGLAVAVALR